MRSSDSGIAAIVVGTIIVSAIITLVTEATWHWPIVLLGIVVGLMAVASINGR